MVVEKIISRAIRTAAKEAAGGPKDVHARREVARFIHDKEVVKILFGEIALKVGQRPGGYTRVVKLGRRFGDAAEVAVLELVDYNTGKEETKSTVKPKRARRTPRKKTETAPPPAAEPAPDSQSTVTKASEKEAT